MRGFRHLLNGGLVALSLLSSSVFAMEIRDDFPSCYGLLDRQAEPVGGTSARSLTVIIDQTIPLPDQLKRDVAVKVNRFVQPGDRINIISFSAFFDDQYTDLLLSGSIDPVFPDSERDSVNKKLLRKFDACMRKQNAFVTDAVAMKLMEGFKEARSDYPRTELVGTLYEISESVIAQDSSSEKIVLLVSDMLENSATASFYGRGMEKAIPAESILEKFKQGGLVPNLNGVRIYIVGAGTLPDGGKYRSQEYMRSLKTFWSLWSESAGAELVGWGQPALLTDLR